MKNTIRCCISCILPCGALDVIRIVHTNGRVEEITGSILASEVMKAHPRHVLKKPSSAGCADYHGVVPKIVIVPPDAQLQRGKIYFLMPLPPSSSATSTSAPAAKSSRRRVSKEKGGGGGNCKSAAAGEVVMTSDDRYLSEIMSTEKVLSAGQRDRRRSGGGGRAGVWRPHLESISESAFNISSSSSSTTDRDSLC